MPIPTKTLAFDEPETAIAKVETPDLTMFERLARDPSVSVDNLERLVQLYERQEQRRAQERFHAAMSEAQRQMRPIAADATNPQTSSRYATYAKLDSALRPIYTSHGFALSFNTADGAAAGWVRVLCKVSHAGGHVEPYHLDMPADGKGAKGGDVMTLTHAVGAGMSYGMRYLLKMIFNVAVGEDDRDGNMPTDRPQPKAVDGYQDWLDDLAVVADSGWAAFDAAWQKSKPEFRNHLTKTDAMGLAKLKTKARGVK